MMKVAHHWWSEVHCLAGKNNLINIIMSGAERDNINTLFPDPEQSRGVLRAHNTAFSAALSSLPQDAYQHLSMLFTDAQLKEQFLLEFDPRTDVYWSHSIPLNLGFKPFLFLFDGVDAYLAHCYDLCALNCLQKPDEVQLKRHLAAMLADDRCLLVLSLIAADKEQLFNWLASADSDLVEKIRAKYSTQSLPVSLSFSSSSGKYEKDKSKLRLVFLLDPIDSRSTQKQALAKINTVLDAFEDQGRDYVAFVLYSKGGNSTVEPRWITLNSPIEGDDLSKFFDSSDVVFSFGRYNQMEIMVEAWQHRTIPVVAPRSGLKEAAIGHGPVLFWPDNEAVNTSEKDRKIVFAQMIRELISMSGSNDASMGYDKSAKDHAKCCQRAIVENLQAASTSSLERKDTLKTTTTLTELRAKISEVRLHEMKSISLPLASVPQPVLHYYRTVISQRGPLLDVQFEKAGISKMERCFREMKLEKNIEIIESVFRFHFDSLHKMNRFHFIVPILYYINKIVFLLRIKKTLVVLLPTSVVNLIKYFYFISKKF